MNWFGIGSPTFLRLLCAALNPIAHRSISAKTAAELLALTSGEDTDKKNPQARTSTGKLELAAFPNRGGANEDQHTTAVVHTREIKCTTADALLEEKQPDSPSHHKKIFAASAPLSQNDNVSNKELGPDRDLRAVRGQLAAAKKTQQSMAPPRLSLEKDSNTIHRDLESSLNEGTSPRPTSLVIGMSASSHSEHPDSSGKADAGLWEAATRHSLILLGDGEEKEGDEELRSHMITREDTSEEEEEEEEESMPGSTAISEATEHTSNEVNTTGGNTNALWSVLWKGQ